MIHRCLILTFLLICPAWWTPPASAAPQPPADINAVPYIATYYIQPKVAPTDRPVIRYYVTDAAQTEYMTDQTPPTFTIDYWVNGSRKTIRNVKAGDNSVTLDRLPAGKVLFALQATDGRGRKSHRLFHEFLIVDPADAAIPQDKVLHPDLARFGIHNDDTHPVETTAGLTEMIQWASDNGYRKVVLPRGRYRLDENATVQMASNITLDMNGSTFKLNPNALAKALMLEFVDCYDAHVINGTFEGDLKEHDFDNAPNNSEWVHAIGISQGSEYCTVKDVTIIDITGYGTTTNHRHTYDRSQSVTGFTPGDIDANGNRIASEVRTTSENLVDISAFLESYGFIQMGVYLGYQGNPAGAWVYRAHFYDADQKYLETIEGYMYRRLYPPKQARFARFTLLSTATPDNLKVYNFRQPYNCAFINVHHENIRCVGMALAGFVNMLVEGCTFTNCGWASARCAFDAEDGWDLMQDLTFRNNTFGENPANEFLTCGGHNFVMTNNTMKVYIWDRTKGVVFHDNIIEGASFRFGKANRSGYPRIQGNTFTDGVSLVLATKEPDRAWCIRDNVCEAGVSSRVDGDHGDKVFFYQCKITGGNVNAKVVDSDIANVKNAGGTFEIHGSRIRDSLLKQSGYGNLVKVVDCDIANTQMRTQGGTMLIQGSRLVDSPCEMGSGWSDGNEFILTDNNITTSLDHLVYVNNSYKSVQMRGNTVTSTSPDFSAVVLVNPTKDNLKNQSVAIEGNTFNARGGRVLNVRRLPHPDCTLTISFTNNVLKGIAKTSDNIAEADNVKLTLSAR